MNSNVKDQAPAIRIIGDEVVMRMALDYEVESVSTFDKAGVHAYEVEWSADDVDGACRDAFRFLKNQTVLHPPLSFGVDERIGWVRFRMAKVISSERGTVVQGDSLHPQLAECFQEAADDADVDRSELSVGPAGGIARCLGWRGTGWYVVSRCRGGKPCDAQPAAEWIDLAGFVRKCNDALLDVGGGGRIEVACFGSKLYPAADIEAFPPMALAGRPDINPCVWDQLTWESLRKIMARIDLADERGYLAGAIERFVDDGMDLEVLRTACEQVADQGMAGMSAERAVWTAAEAIAEGRKKQD